MIFEILKRSCNVCVSLSSQLYERSTHFLLEIIQNADDNTYTAPTPTLTFSYAPGTLRIECNEVGFTADDVEAICAINQSTKSSKKSDGEYIGEKGIGFKSVFKAAEVVWIASREYTFKFDKSTFLGMVTPIWAKFPESRPLDWTSIHLSLSKGFDEEELVRELRTFDPNVLIFLRCLKEIRVRVEGKDGTTEKSFRKHDGIEGQDEIVTLKSCQSVAKYLIRTHVIEDLPVETKRLHWKRTKILLGFPLMEDQTAPVQLSQKVYAFLPVRNYGLKVSDICRHAARISSNSYQFLLQGDFILTASREDIESTLPWNCRLRDAVAEAFLESVHHFNTGDLKYVWPWYLPDPCMTTSSFFDASIRLIRENLQELCALESCAGTMEKARLLVYVPANTFADSSGDPFTLSPHTATRYLTPKYPSWTIPSIIGMGVLQLSPRRFLEDLECLVRQEPQFFRTKTLLWHAQLADCLYRLTTDEELLSLMQKIPFIPLQDNTWVPARGNTIVFSKGSSLLDVPSGIDVHIVHKSAESNTSRHRLMASLGVKTWEMSDICRAITAKHGAPTFDPTALTTSQLVSHAIFLHKASWRPHQGLNIWFATSQEQRCLGKDLYIAGICAADSATSRVFTSLRKHFPIIHAAYLTTLASDMRWYSWLVEVARVSMIPRLITPVIEPKLPGVQAAHTTQDYQGTHDSGTICLLSLTFVFEYTTDFDTIPDVHDGLGPNFALSEEFEHMFRTCESSDVLQIMRDNWQYYSRWIDGAHMEWQTPGFIASSDYLKDQLGSCVVRTTMGPLPLRTTILPAIDPWLEQGLAIPALDISDPHHAGWSFLTSFGVLLVADINYYVRCLVAASEQEDVNLSQIAYIYERVQSFYRGNEAMIKYV